MGIQSQPAMGVNARIALGNELAPGVPVTGAALDRKICFTTESLARTESELESATICGCDTGSTRGRVRGARGSVDVAGDISAELSPEEYGRLIRHAVGDVVVLKNGIANARGRNILPYNSAGADKVVSFSNYATFSSSGKFGVVYRNSNGVLTANDNAGAGYSFTASSEYLLTRVTAVTMAGANPTIGDTITLSSGVDSETFLDPEGILSLEIGGVKYAIGYNTLVDTAPTFTVTITSIREGALALGSVLTAVTLMPIIPVGTPAYQVPSLIGVAGITPGLSYGTGTNIPSGVWFYELWDEALADPAKAVYMHHYEIGNSLPVGLTINILRDTVGFIYSGMKVNEWSINFESQNYVTSTWSFMGIAEYSVAELAREAKIGDTTIYLVDEPVAFNRSGGTLTIGEEQKIRYTSIVGPSTSASGLWEVQGITASGVESIQQVHLIGENVDCSVLAAAPLDCNDSPRLTSMDAIVSMDYKLIEVLSGSLTLSNNIDGSKYMLGSRNRAALREARAAVSGSLSVEFDDGQHYKRYINGDMFDVEFRVYVDDREYTRRFGVEAPVSVVFYCPQCKYSGATPSVQDESYLNVDMPFDAYDDKRGGLMTTALVVSVTNYTANSSL